MRTLVIGAGGAVGETIAHLLTTAGCDVTAAMRGDHPAAAARLAAAGADVRRVDLDCSSEVAAALRGVDAVVLTPILTASVRAAPLISQAGVQNTIFFSSNNVAVDPANPIYAALNEAEFEVRATLPRATILRPTLIYGDPRLPAVPRLIRLLRRSPIVPIPGGGRALQQPIFHEDLAYAAATLARDQASAGGIFALGGPDIVSQKEFMLLVSRLLGGLRIPVFAPRILLEALRSFVPLPLDAAQIHRLDADKIVAPVDPVPPAIAPRTGLHDGLRRLIEAIRLHEPAWRADIQPA